LLIQERHVPINELRAIETFARAVELGSFRRAAVAQGVSPQAASQAVAQLEEHLGVRLLHRTTRSLSLTEAGQQLLESTRPALSSIERALQRVRSTKDDIAGVLRIVAPRSGFVTILWPVIDAYCQKHPEVTPDVHLDDEIGNWVTDRVDVGFRIGGPPGDELIARPLFAVQLIICAAPDYLKRHGKPRSLEDLAGHRCSVFRHPVTGQTFPWYLHINGEVVQRHVAPTLAINDIDLELQAVLSGQVIAQVSAMSAASLIRSGHLVPLFPQYMTEHMHLYIYYGSRKAQPARVRQFIDIAVELLGQNPEFLLSRKELAAAEAKASLR
jgi:DNA-binding transcriptional LysR family regulator